MSISCEHGLLRRQCALCDAIQENSELRTRIAELEEALGSIAKRCQESRSQTRRIRWIEQRATAALTGEPFKEHVYQMPKNGERTAEKVWRENVRLKAHIAELEAQQRAGVPDVDALAAFIRKVDGSHRMGAGVLAERICDWWASDAVAVAPTPKEQQRAGVPDDFADVMRAVFREIEVREGNRGNAPGHGHSIPGIWDSDNGELAGKPCAWCALWNKAKAMLAAAPAPAPKAQERAEHKLSAAGVFKGAEGLRGLLDAQDFWDQQPYGTRLYFGEMANEYLHRDVLRAAVALLDQRQEQAPQPAEVQHVLYTNADADAPDAIKDLHGDVVLGLCKVCGQAEGDLEKQCPGPKKTPAEVGADDDELTRAYHRLKAGNYEVSYRGASERRYDIEMLWQARAQLTKGADAAEVERETIQLIEERDQAEEWADKLAGAIAKFTGFEIGEHSNLNNPWSEALEALIAAGGREEWANQAVEAMQRARFAMEMNHWNWKSEASNDMKREAYRLIDAALAASQPAQEVHHD